MLISDAVGLAMLRMVEPETDEREFDTGKAERLCGVIEQEYEEVSPGRIVVSSTRMRLHCRDSDITEHELVKQSRLVRVSDEAVFFVKGLEPDGTGMTVVTLSS